MQRNRREETDLSPFPLSLVPLVLFIKIRREDRTPLWLRMRGESIAVGKARRN